MTLIVQLRTRGARKEMGESFSTYGGVVFLFFGDRLDVGEVFFSLFLAYTYKKKKKDSALNTVNFRYETRDHIHRVQGVTLGSRFQRMGESFFYTSATDGMWVTSFFIR